MPETAAIREAKPPFESIPPDILARIGAIANSRVVSGEIAWGGFSASAGFVLTLENGGKVFAKGTHPDEMAHGTLHLQQEVRAYEQLSVLKDLSPAYLGQVDDGDEDGWALGVFDFVPHDPAGPEVAEIFSQLARLRCAAPPESLGHCSAQNYIDMFFTPVRKWWRLADEPAVRAGYAAAMADTPWGEDFLHARLPQLCAAQDRIGVLAAEMDCGILHGDLRLDNIFKGQNGRTYIIDWPNVCYGPHVFDLLTLFADMQGQGRGRIADLLAAYESATGIKIDRNHVTTMALCIAGFLADQVRRAVPEKLPRLRIMQKRILCALLDYAAPLS